MNRLANKPHIKSNRIKSNRIGARGSCETGACCVVLYEESEFQAELELLAYFEQNRRRALALGQVLDARLATYMKDAQEQAPE